MRVMTLMFALAACGRVDFAPLPPDGGDAGGDASGDGSMVTTYSDLGSLTSWSVYNVGTQITGAQGFLGGAFDGRQVYFIPQQYGLAPSGHVTRVDSQGVFSDAASWEGFDVSTLDANATSFETAAFDGRYLYLVPDGGSVTARFDTQGGFTSTASWTMFDLSAVNAGARGFASSAYDGRYVYFIGHDNGAPSGLVLRYDTQATFNTAGSWSVFDVAGVNASAVGFAGAAFDGRYLYLVPGRYASAVTARLDTSASFTSMASWTVFDIASVPGANTGFSGGTFDGRYVYYAPYYNNTVYQGVVTRYDTTGAFADVAAWETFDLTTQDTNARGFNGASFDGRYVYLVPNQFGAYKIVARHDSTQPLSTGWSLLDMTAIPGFAGGFYGAVFDGAHMYFVPFNNGNSGVIARFDAKSPPMLPARSNASFY